MQRFKTVTIILILSALVAIDLYGYIWTGGAGTLGYTWSS